MAPKFALFTKGSKLPLNKGFKNMFELLQSCAQPSLCLSFAEIGDIAGVAEVTIKQAYKLMYPKALDLFPPDFQFYTPIEQLPTQ